MLIYYKQFADIQNVHFVHDDEQNYNAIIVCKTEADAVNIQAINRHIEIIPTAEKDYMLGAYKKINDLNDDCLYKIFDYLNVADLCNLASIGLRFKRIAGAVFSKQPEAKTICLWSENEKTKGIEIMKHLGHVIASANCSSDLDFDANILAIMVKHCAGNLKELFLSDFHLTWQEVFSLRPLLGGLEKLKLHNCTGPILLFCDALKDLKIEGGFSGILIDTHLSELESFSFGYFPSDYMEFNGHSHTYTTITRTRKLTQWKDHWSPGVDCLKMFLEKNPHMKKIDLYKNVNTLYADAVYEFLETKSPNIEELILFNNEHYYKGSFEKSLTQILTLKDLKVLHLDWKSNNDTLQSFLEKVARKKTITELKLRYTVCSPSNALIKTICNVKKLITLEIHFEEKKYLEEITNNSK